MKFPHRQPLLHVVLACTLNELCTSDHLKAAGIIFHTFTFLELCFASSAPWFVFFLVVFLKLYNCRDVEKGNKQNHRKLKIYVCYLTQFFPNLSWYGYLHQSEPLRKLKQAPRMLSDPGLVRLEEFVHQDDEDLNLVLTRCVSGHLLFLTFTPQKWLVLCSTVSL